MNKKGIQDLGESQDNGMMNLNDNDDDGGSDNC